MTNLRRHTPSMRQRGAALIVGLVLMMVLTILAISTMRTSTLELAMAGNTQYQQTARQLAEAGIADALDRVNRDVFDPVAANDGNWGAFPGLAGVELDPGSGDTYSVEIRYLISEDPPPGYSTGAGTEEAHFFELRSTGATAARNARSVLRRGFWIYAD